jgi:hypothetical protein
MSDLVTAIRTWRRPIQIKMRRPRAIRAKRRTRKTTQKHVIKKNYGGGGRRGGGRAGQLKKIDWYLVKWTQMSFKHVSWEKSTHINDDLAVAKFHRYQSPPTQSRTDAKRQLEVKQRYRENVKMPFKWETTHPITHTPNTPDEDDVAFVLADVVRRVACKPMLADGWSLYRSVSSGQSLLGSLFWAVSSGQSLLTTISCFAQTKSFFFPGNNYFFLTIFFFFSTQLFFAQSTGYPPHQHENLDLRKPGVRVAQVSGLFLLFHPCCP